MNTTPKPTRDDLIRLWDDKETVRMRRDKAKAEWEKLQVEYEQARHAYFMAYDAHHAKDKR